MRKYVLCLIPLILALVSGQELLVNGDFEQELTVGWTRVDSGSGTHEVLRDPTYQPDPDYEACVYMYDNPGWTRLSQVVDAPGVVLQLSFWAKFEEAGGSSTCWPAACVIVNYYDAMDVLLGETRYYYSTYADWIPSPTLSLHRVVTPDWTEYTLDVAEEIGQNLPGVNPADVARVGVALLSYTSGG